MQRKIIRILNVLVSAVEMVCLVVILAYAVYSLWDDQQLYNSVGDLQSELLAFKPEEKDPTEAFRELQRINPDVCAWLTMDDTGIDYPVLRGSNNFVYLSRNAYGEPDLAGSIYLDSRNLADYSHPYNLLHGHHMDQGRMFGDLDLYKDETFFRKTTGGKLFLPDGSYDLTVFAYLLVKSTDDTIFAPQRWTKDHTALLDFAREHAVFLHEGPWQQARDGGKVLSLATCSTEFTDARTIILCLMTRAEEEQEVQP